jgi:hypothetical protein
MGQRRRRGDTPTYMLRSSTARVPEALRERTLSLWARIICFDSVHSKMRRQARALARRNRRGGGGRLGAGVVGSGGGCLRLGALPPFLQLAQQVLGHRENTARLFPTHKTLGRPAVVVERTLFAKVMLAPRHYRRAKVLPAYQARERDVLLVRVRNDVLVGVCAQKAAKRVRETGPVFEGCRDVSARLHGYICVYVRMCARGATALSSVRRACPVPSLFFCRSFQSRSSCQPAL